MDSGTCAADAASSRYRGSRLRLPGRLYFVRWGIGVDAPKTVCGRWRFPSPFLRALRLRDSLLARGDALLLVPVAMEWCRALLATDTILPRLRNPG